MTSRGDTTFTPADLSVLDGDPFWSVVLREQPDLELILVGGPAEPEVVAEDPEPVLRAAVDQLAGAWRLLRPLVAAADPTEPDRAPSIRWQGKGLLLQRAVIGIGEPGGVDLLRAAAVALDRVGWGLRPALHGGHALLEARAGASRFRGEAGPGATVLAIHSPPLAVRAEHRAGLRAQLAAELRS